MDERQRKAIMEMLLRRTDENTQSDEMAKNWLIEEGLLDQAGKLRPQFGGEGDKEGED
ncbi:MULTISPECIES: hypothetical protein [unclassified Novosphingobium]|uniref:hypothetical protein n=1 Tax=unclassified Novosphingobium TaxID=2644732 RepID=UPI0025E74376|nr:MULTISPECIES: hypothetical protein [unclassified Novosphingobium]